MELLYCGINTKKDNKELLGYENVPNGELFIQFDKDNKKYVLRRLDGKRINGTENVGGLFLGDKKKPSTLNEIIDYYVYILNSIQSDMCFEDYAWFYNEDQTEISIYPEKIIINPKINKEMKEYIDNKILPQYKENDLAHDIDHIQYVINRSLEFAKTIEGINFDMVYAIAAYHDLGHHIDAKNHEMVSAELLLDDDNLENWFTEDEILTMAQAIIDHRASLKGEPRSVYGRIISSADRNVLVEGPLRRTYEYRRNHYPDMPLEQIIEDSKKHIVDKFGKKGYASDKMYFEDLDYEKFLEEISLLVSNDEEFKRRYCEINNILVRKLEK